MNVRNVGLNLIKVNNKDTRAMSINVALVSLLLTFNKFCTTLTLFKPLLHFHTSVFVSDFEQVLAH